MSKYLGKIVSLLDLDTDDWIDCKLIGFKVDDELRGYILQPLDEFPEEEEQ